MEVPVHFSICFAPASRNAPWGEGAQHHPGKGWVQREPQSGGWPSPYLNAGTIGGTGEKMPLLRLAIIFKNICPRTLKDMKSLNFTWKTNAD